MDNETLKIQHVYGQTVIESVWCSACGTRSFVIQSKLACCGKVPPACTRVEIIFETSTGKRKQPSKKEQERILKAQNNRCLYCNDEFDSWRELENGFEPVKLNWDHYCPFSYTLANTTFVAACSRCNHAKSNLMFNTLEEAQIHCVSHLERKTRR